jgi:hypothetical protein
MIMSLSSFAMRVFPAAFVCATSRFSESFCFFAVLIHALVAMRFRAAIVSVNRVPGAPLATKILPAVKPTVAL